MEVDVNRTGKSFVGGWGQDKQSEVFSTLGVDVNLSCDNLVRLWPPVSLNAAIVASYDLRGALADPAVGLAARRQRLSSHAR
jgi:hypothetical protein